MKKLQDLAVSWAKRPGSAALVEMLALYAQSK